MALSKTQIDKLGQRLRSAEPTEDDLRELDEHRRSFEPAYEQVTSAIRDQMNLQSTGRPAKSTPSIIEKLRRESIRLTQMQDIAGCRIVVSDTLDQDHVTSQLIKIFPAASVVDRRVKPSYGYRAVHVIVTIDDRPVEVQVRTEIQHTWAQMCEQFADQVDPSIKYGGGSEGIAIYLATSSSVAARIEVLEGELQEVSEADRTAHNVDIHGLRNKLTAELTDMMKTLSEGNIRSERE